MTGVAVIAASAARSPGLPPPANETLFHDRLNLRRALAALHWSGAGRGDPEPVEQMAAAGGGESTRRTNRWATTKGVCAQPRVLHAVQAGRSLRRRRRAQFPEIAGRVLLVTRATRSPPAAFHRWCHSVRLDLHALHQRDLSGDSSIDQYGALAKPIPCSPLIEPSSATTRSNSSRSASARAPARLRRPCCDHQVDVDVAVAGVTEARRCAARGGA